MSGVQDSTRTLRIRYLLGVLVTLVTIDGIISQLLIRSGLGREGNPFLEPLVGQRMFIPIKVLGAILCAFILWDIYKRWPKLALIATSFFVIMYTAIVVWNVASVLILQA